MKNIINMLLASMLMLMCTPLIGQEVEGVQQQNFDYSLMYHRQMLHPTFSIVRQNNSYGSVYFDGDTSGFENASTIGAHFGGKIGESQGAGGFVYFAKGGLYRNIGIDINYAKQVQFGEDTALAFGMNFGYLNSSFDDLKVIDIDDPRLAAGSQSFAFIRPGINMQLWKIDFGVYAKDLFIYNINERNTVQTDGVGLVAHLMFTQPFEFNNWDSRMQLFVKTEKSAVNEVDASDTDIYGGFLLDVLKYGWIQAGYNTNNSYGFGLGAKWGKMAIGVTMVKPETTVAFESSYNFQLSAAYNFSEPETKSRFKRGKKRKKTNIIAKRKKKKRKKKKVAKRSSRVKKRRPGSSTGNVVKRRKKTTSPEEVASVEETPVAEVPKEEPKEAEPVKEVVKEEPVKEEPVKEIKEEPVKEKVTPKTEPKHNDWNNFVSTTKKLKIKQRKVESIEGVEPGFYLIANVFEKSHYYSKFYKNLTALGLTPGSFINPENKYTYVYLDRLDSWKEAIRLLKNNVDGKYQGEMWIFAVGMER